MQGSLSERELYGEVCRIGSAIANHWSMSYRARNAVWYAAIEHDVHVLTVVNAVMRFGNETERRLTNEHWLDGGFDRDRRPVIIAGDRGGAA